VDLSDIGVVKAVGKQLQVLEAYALAQYLGRGWKRKS
jgi:hypothetical protein